ncbi:hypothetical protein S4A8_01535 [Salinisphaera sp. S4-8]
MKTGLMSQRVEESERLHELRGLDLLDTPFEDRFDQYTRLVASVFNVPTALITLVERDRQWFKSLVGFDRRETPIEESFCAYALPLDLLYVPDATADRRFHDNALVLGEPYIRFYAGAVLRGPTGQPLGTLCVIDSRPRELSDVEKWRLMMFARIVESEINLHRQFDHWSLGLQHRAMYDAVTALPGRALFEELIANSWNQIESGGRTMTMVHLHLSNFEILHSLVGRAGCDHVISTIAQRLSHDVYGDDRIGMLGSKRIGVVMTAAADAADDTLERVNTLMRSLAAPIEYNGVRLTVDIKAGISRAPDDAHDVETLIAHARMAAAEAQHSPDGVRRYSSDVQRAVARSHERHYRLAEALRADALDQVYQPIVECGSGRIIGVEALARWTDGEHGQVSPDEFIPIAEADPELRRLLTVCTLNSACRQLAEWREAHEVVPYVAVNIAGEELYCEDFADMVAGLIAQHGVPASHLVLEITEQSVITDVGTAAETMLEMRVQGFRFAIDDFGTGYSSLRYLQQLPLDILKIDRSFTQLITQDTTSHELTSGILQIARTLDLAVIAEGVETEAQYAVLKQLGAGHIQGFLLGRPQPAQAITEQLYGSD